MASITAAHYLAGVVGVALLRRWYENGEVNERRLDELGAILTGRDQRPFRLALDPVERAVIDGYAEWASSYDEPNPLIAAEERYVHDALSPACQEGTHALDAACGTGRHAAFLVEQGADVVGIDCSAPMLAVARAKLPTARFVIGDLEALPLEDATVDVAVCALALCHLSDPTAALAEFARVLRPGGTLVISDPHPMAELIGGQAFYGGLIPAEPMRYVRNHRHGASTWLAAFAAGGLDVQECREVPFTADDLSASPAAAIFPEAVRDAAEGLPALWLWVVRRSARA